MDSYLKHMMPLATIATNLEIIFLANKTKEVYLIFFNNPTAIKNNCCATKTVKLLSIFYSQCNKSKACALYICKHLKHICL